MMAVSQPPASSLRSTGLELCPITAGDPGPHEHPGFAAGGPPGTRKLGGEGTGEECPWQVLSFFPWGCLGPGPLPSSPEDPVTARWGVGGTSGSGGWVASLEAQVCRTSL